MFIGSMSFCKRCAKNVDVSTVVDAWGIFSRVIVAGVVPRVVASAMLSIGVAGSAAAKDHKLNRNFVFMSI